MDPKVFDMGYKHPLLGLDEVGTGSIAGPMVAAGVVLNLSEEEYAAAQDLGVRDSKKMTAEVRLRAYRFLLPRVAYCRTVFIMPADIDRLGHTACVDEMFANLMRVYRARRGSYGTALLDGLPRRGIRYPAEYVVQGDALSLTIAAASVVAKVERDCYMDGLHTVHPEYGFDAHRGYVTKAHKEALARLGPCGAHRKSTRPVKESLELHASRIRWSKRGSSTT